MTTLLLAHAHASVRPLYEAALPGVRVVPFTSPFAGFSSAYDKLAAHLGRPLLPRLYQWLVDRGEDLDAPGPIVLGWWSAAYALARAVAADPESRAAIPMWVGLDGGHASLDPDGTASDAGVRWAVDLAREAARGERLFWYGHTDVRTAGYASTTQVAAELLRLAGPPAGLWHVEPHDEEVDPGAEHVAALRGWGPWFVARALSAWTERAGSEPQVEEQASLGERSVRRALAELARGAGERPAGSNGGPDVRAYLAGCVRDLDGDGDLDPLRLTSGEWCAAAACWAAYSELRPGEEPPPHAWRAAGIEIERDAKALGAWLPAAEAHSAPPRRGDLVVVRRAGPAWARHVARVETAPDEDGRYRTIGGNEGDAWRLTWRRLDDPKLLGFVRYR